MCGILGILSPKNEEFNQKYFQKTADILFALSESRGKESAGAALKIQDELRVLKQPRPSGELIKNPLYRSLFRGDGSRFLIGHARLVTNGNMESNTNNQPVVKDNIIGVHNGIITNIDALWQKNQKLGRNFEVDTEILLSLVRQGLSRGQNLAQATASVFSEIEGAASIGLIFADQAATVLATNTGSLYYILSKKKDILMFASEYDILYSLFDRINLQKYFDEKKIEHLESGSGLIVSDDKLKMTKFGLKSPQLSRLSDVSNLRPLEIRDLSTYVIPAKAGIQPGLDSKSCRRLFESERGGSGLRVERPVWNGKKIIAEFEKNNQIIAGLRRCTKCILPETIPYIEFDDQGVCNYCRSYKKIEVKGKDQLEKDLKPYRKKGNQADVLMTFSGGRDSSYGLHYFKEELGMKPVAYSYDWGMLTDLGRRNQSRMTAKLGVEHILISADIRNKRANIRRNVAAWLKQPDLGTVPLFMAGDKQYFYYANKLGKQMGIDLIVLCINPLEKTNFKFGFCGIKPDENVTYRLGIKNKTILAGYYAKHYLTNPAYLNQSLMDTLFAYFSYYLIPHEYLSLFDYIYWDEKEIEKTLLKTYNWETAPDTKSTWRIGDGTAPFYNYIYYTLAGFTENDTFRSNQIREGVMKRQDALRLSQIENQPRFESMQWYFDTIGLDMEKALQIINRTPKLYDEKN